MQAFYTELFSTKTRRSRYLDSLARLTKASLADMVALAEAITWVPW